MSTDLGGQKLGQYELRERLGRGGMADVYKAFQPGMERFVAIKVMLGHLATDAEFVERFRREARAVGQLRHPNIVSVFDFGIERDIYYMVMEFIRGENLKAYISRHPQGVPLDDALRIAGQIADALDYAHKAGMIHRDVKPANIMFVDDTHQQAILTDFGIAHLLSQPGLTASGAMVGTPAYLSPEIASGRSADERADIYGLGIILYEMLTGRVPYEADTPLAIIMQHVNAPLPSPAEFGRELPDIVEAIILKAMMKNPDDRYQTAAEMKEALDSVRAVLKDTSRRPVVATDQTERVAVAPKPLPTQPAEERATTYVKAPTSRPPVMWIGLGVVALVAVIAVGIILSQNQPPAPLATPTEQPTQIAEVVTEEATATEPEPTATEPEPTATTAPTDVPPSETPAPSTTNTDVPTNTPTSTATLTHTPAPTNTSTPTDVPTEPPAPTGVATLPANVSELREAGLLSGLTPLQDEIDALLLEGRVSDATRRLDQILVADPQNIDALAARALLLNQVGDSEGALAAADRAIEVAPDSPLGYIARSDALQNWAVNDDAGTLEAAEQALEIDPDNPEALWRASVAQGDLGHSEAAASLLEQARAAGATGYRFADYAADYYFYNSDYEQALPYMQTRYSADLTNEYHLRMLVSTLLYLDRAGEAYELVRSFPAVITDWDDLSAAAYVAYRAGEYAQAREWAETAVALSDQAYAATYVLGLISWYADGDLNASLRYFDQLAAVENFYDDYLSTNYGHELNLDRGRILLQAGEGEAAVESFTRALESFGEYPVVYEALADAYLALGNYTAARDNLRLALERTYDNADEQRRLLDRVRAVGALVAAAPTLEPTPEPTEEAPEPTAQAVEIDLMSGLTPLQDEIDTLIISGDWDEVDRRITTTLRDEPNNVDALTARSLYYRDMGDMQRALTDADRVIALAPESPLGYIARAEALLIDGSSGNASRALQAVNTALSLDPENPDALWRASLAYANMGDWVRQVEYLNRAIDAGAQGWRFANFAGEFLHYAGEYERAQPYLEAWYASHPSDLYSTLFLAANLVELERYDEALYRMQNYPGEYETYEQLAWPAYVAYRAGAYDEARDWANQALAKERNAPGAHYVLGLISWYVDGDVSEATRHLNVLRGFPTFWDVFLNPDKGHQPQYDLGRILLEAGRVDEAIAAFSRSLREDARPYTYEALADAYLAQGNSEAALENLQAARDMLGDDPDEQARLTDRITELGGE